MPQLNERERQILSAVVHTYITTAEPIGSRSVVKRFDLDLSPATVRNTMADLEELGFLQQVHTSSGRVPTDRGYRYYVDYLMQVQDLTFLERDRIEQEFTAKLNDCDEVLRQTSHLLALVSHQASIVEAPGEDVAEVRRLEVLPVSASRLVVLVVDNFGRVRPITLQMETVTSAQELESLNRFLNQHLKGIQVENLVPAMESRLQTFMDEQRALADRALSLLRLLPTHRDSLLFLDGATQLIDQPEFSDIGRAREVLDLLGQRGRLEELLRTAINRGQSTRSTILIGSEGVVGGVDGISLVASPYKIDGKTVGMIGVLGPRRMHYSRLTALVEFTSDMMGKLLTRLGR